MCLFRLCLLLPLKAPLSVTYQHQASKLANLLSLLLLPFSDREEEERGSSSRRNRRQKTCAASVATKTSTALDDRRTAEGDNGLVCSVVHKNGVSNSGGSNGNHLVEESAAVIKEIAVPGAENSGMVRACRRANGDSGKKKKKGATGRNRAHKVKYELV